MSDSAKYPSLKALLILEAMTKSSKYFGINDICAETGLSQSTVHRIMGELLINGYVEKNEALHKYTIGVKTLILASSFMNSSSIIKITRPEMIKLNKISDETVHLISLSGNDVIYLDKINTKHTIGLMSTVGKRNPIHCTSGGKAIIAYKSEDWLADYLKNSERKKYTENTLTEEDEIREELEKIRKTGYALDLNEHHADILCVAVPIFDYHNKVSVSISISAPAYRFNKEKALSFVDNLKEAAVTISAKLNSII